jgi:hypothetical protein
MTKAQKNDQAPMMKAHLQKSLVFMRNLSFLGHWGLVIRYSLVIGHWRFVINEEVNHDRRS